MSQEHQLSLYSECICVAEGELGLLCGLQPWCCVVLLAVGGGGARAGAQVTIVKLSHMGCGGVTLGGASGLL